MSDTATAPITKIDGRWTLDKVHSTAGFAVKHMVVSTFRGRFEDFDVTLNDGHFDGTVRVDSIAIKDENLAAHLKAPDFFDSERHPEIRFTSTDLRRDGDQVVLDGELTIKGTTRPVEARGTVAGPAEDPFGNIKLGLALDAIVDRTAFGLDWNAPLPKGGFALANDVTLTVELELVAAEG